MMNTFFTDKLNTTGEHLFLYQGLVGALETALTVPENRDTRYIAILGHPHSLQGGTMNNKVVTTLGRAFKDLGIASFRFNFRGVGQTEGEYDAGIGESDDMLLIVRRLLEEQPDVRLIFAGFSFGSYVAYRAAAQCRHSLLISVAPPVHHYNFKEFTPEPSPWVMIHGEDDEVVPLNEVLDFLKHTSSDIPLFRFAETGHFFHGKLIELKLRLIDIIRAKVSVE